MKRAYDSDAKTREVIDTAKKLEGLVRGAGVHAAGVVIAPEPLTHLVPLARAKNDEIVTAYDMKAIEKSIPQIIDGLGPQDHVVVKGAFMVKSEMLKGTMGEG